MSLDPPSADSRQEMDLAARPQRLKEPERRDARIDRHGDAWTQGAPLTQTRLDTWVKNIKGVQDFANRLARYAHRLLTARQPAQGHRNPCCHQAGPARG